MLSLDLATPGRHQGVLAVPHSHDGSAYGQVRVPLLALVGGPGPTALLCGGVHGDEGEGPLALPALARALDPAALAGRVIIAPVLNPLALAAGRRTSPQDQGNLARMFPGDQVGSITQRLAAAINDHLLPLADAVLDLHAGGHSLHYAPTALVRVAADAALAVRVEHLAMALGLPRVVLSAASGVGGTLVAAALARGRPALATEIGGAGGVTAASLALAEQAARGFLGALGLLPALAVAPPRRLHTTPGMLLRAPARGLFHPAFTLGDTVQAGQPAGTLHDPDRPFAPPEMLHFPAGGEVVAQGVGVLFAAGDALAQVAAAT